ncbi:MAG: 3-deoxy-D-manno-octulosonic acid transferase [Muribaculaceae bacterium]|nr:3-deoxy-D-manno-octulosonic acid transferase [Muribaculaceae bacterium]
MLTGQARTMDYLNKVIDRNTKYIWIHVSSLGEFEQGRPLIELLKVRMPEKKILLTFFSPSGYEVRKNYKGVDAVCYLPFDLKGRVKKFLDVVNPEMAIFVKYEFWGNYLEELHCRNIPTYLISAIFRDTQSFFKWWGGMFRKMLRCYTHLYVQDEASQQLLLSIGITNVTIAGDTRFDRVTDILANSFEISQAKVMTQNVPVTIVAGSTWAPDEQLLLPYFNSHSGVKLIIAPHEINENRLAEIEHQLHRPYCRLSTATDLEASNTDCLIVDSFGKLSSIYRYGQIAYVGGGFGVGIHNINEAAVYGMPVVFGPKYKKFKEAKDLISVKGAYSIKDNAEFVSVMDNLLTNADAIKLSGERAGEYIRQNLGATEKIYNDIFGK